jgi:hypothetical protein
VSVVIGDQRSGDRLPGLVVVPHGGGHRQDALGDADGDAAEGAPGVGFEVELAFEGVVSRFDQLADGFERWLAVAGWLVLAGGPQEGDTPGGKVSFPEVRLHELHGTPGRRGWARGSCAS